jgi:hypothetical protein
MVFYAPERANHLHPKTFRGFRDPLIRFAGFGISEKPRNTGGFGISEKQSHSNVITTISECVPTRSGGPQVPAP